MAKQRESASKNGKIAFNEQDRVVMREMALNASLMRSTLLNKLIDPRRDIDLECGYPKEITTEQYKLMYDREGIAARIVNLFPEETWAHDPIISENAEADETEFETAFYTLEDERQIFSYLAKEDEISGIGRFGVLLMGFDDGLDLSKSVEGINEKGEKQGNKETKLLFLRAFDESVLTIKGVEKDMNNPRFSRPTSYTISFQDADDANVGSTGKEATVHWSRVIHIADNRKSSEVYGVPRMQPLFNRILDLRKLSGGSAEMFWKGAFPGFAFEMDSNASTPTEAEDTKIKQQIEDYSNGLQRYLRLQGITAKSLAPQTADPKSHIEVQLELIAITLGVPKRIFMGAEQAKLASSQDTKSWNSRVRRRQSKYVTPYIIRPFIDRLIAVGVLPEPKDGYTVEWPDLDSPSDLDKAEVLVKITEAYSKYVAGGVDQLIPPEEYLTMFGKLSTEEVEQIMDAALKREEEMEGDEDGGIEEETE